MQYWHEAPPDYIQERLASVDACNPGLRHMVFDQASALAFIESHFGSGEARAFRSCAVPAMQADYFRYCATFVLGGVYCDADFHCVADMSSSIPPVGNGRLFEWGGGAILNGFFMFGSPGHPLLGLAIEIATANIENRAVDRVHPATGPWIFTSLLSMHRLGSFEAFIERFVGHPNDEISRHYCDVIDDYSRVGQAVQGIALCPADEFRAWLRLPEDDLPYTRTPTHWTNATDIYR